MPIAQGFGPALFYEVYKLGVTEAMPDMLVNLLNLPTIQPITSHKGESASVIIEYYEKSVSAIVIPDSDPGFT